MQAIGRENAEYADKVKVADPNNSDLHKELLLRTSSMRWSSLRTTARRSGMMKNDAGAGMEIFKQDAGLGREHPFCLGHSRMALVWTKHPEV